MRRAASSFKLYLIIKDVLKIYINVTVFIAYITRTCFVIFWGGESFSSMLLL